MLIIFCWMGLHTYRHNRADTKRTCDHCGKKQHQVGYGEDTHWED